MLKISNKNEKVIVIGAGIGGLTTGALLAQKGYDVLILDQAIVPGGCASTFTRKGFIFDVGATQVAGLEPGGIHYQIFKQLNVDLPNFTPCDPACSVYLPGENIPINIWRDPQKWQVERLQHFPKSEPFWQLIKSLFDVSWQFQGRNPILPPGNLWDLWQLIQALRPETLITVPYTFYTVGDALRKFGLENDLRLCTFLDMQLKLYSQVNAEETALLYAATALSVCQSPQGLYHLQGSMQVLSDRLVEALTKYSGKLLMRHTVEKIITDNNTAKGVYIRNDKTGEVWTENADHIVANVTVQNLSELLGDKIPFWYRYRIDKLDKPSGAFVIYLGVDIKAIPEHCPPHLQFLYNYEGEIGENNSLFVSVSKPGDGRAPDGKAVIIASSFVDTRPWWNSNNYEQLKEEYTKVALSRLSQYFNLTEDTIIHIESATPRTFFKYTGRTQGFVGGIGQRISTFAPFGFGNRTPINKLWLVGDSTHPGEGTAGVSYSALTVVNQIEHE